MKKPTIIAIIISIAAVLWVGSGYIFPGETSGNGATTAAKTNDDTAAAPEKNRMKVRVIKSKAQDYTSTVTANGLSEASRTVTIRAEAEGQIVEVIADEGADIATGTDIVKIDVRERKERVRETEELVKQREIEYAAARKLQKQGYTSDVQLAQTQSALEAARANLTRAQIDLEKTTITAPFDGVLGKRQVEVGDYVQVGDPIIEEVDLDPLNVTVFVNEKEVVQLQKGNEAILRFAGGVERHGVISFIAPAADVQSRTFRVDVSFDNAGENRLPAGLTTQVTIAVKSKQAHKISPAILTLDDAGTVGVKTVGDDDVVSFKPVTIIADKANVMWVTGLNDRETIVTVGQDFIAPGQTVEPVTADDANQNQDSKKAENETDGKGA